MVKREERLPVAGERKVKGYAGRIINLTIEKQYLDPCIVARNGGAVLREIG